MTKIAIKIKTISPVLLASSPPASNFIDTLDFIPGNTVRGLLAKRYIDLKGSVDAIFKRLFVHGNSSFGFALPDGAEVIPLSARTCKYEGGFSGDDGHGVADLLLCGPEEKVCGRNECKKAIDYFKGFWLPNEGKQACVKTRLITRSSIENFLGVAKTGHLYTQRVIEEGQTFSAVVEAPDDLSESLSELLKESFIARIGTGKSRGQGWVEVTRAEYRETPVEDASSRYKKYVKRTGRPVLAVTMLSDGLFIDGFLRDSTEPNIEDMAPFGIIPSEWQERPKAYMDVRTVFGFDGAPIFLSRQPRVAVAAGSAFLFEAKGNGASPRISPNNGIGWIGEGRREGYGLAMLWHPFHLDPESERGKTTVAMVAARADFEGHLIRKAQGFYRMGFVPVNISASQMAAVAERIRTASTHGDAVEKTNEFLRKQIEKLEAKVKRGGKPASWMKSVEDGTTTLGKALIDCVTKEEYLKDFAGEAADRLDALQRFWSRLHGFYRYEAATKKEMDLECVDGQRPDKKEIL